MARTAPLLKGENVKVRVASRWLPNAAARCIGTVVDVI
jgi:hypothetical protein